MWKRRNFHQFWSDCSWKTEKASEETIGLKSASAAYSTSWIGWDDECLDVPAGSNRVVVRIYNTNSSDGSVVIGSDYNSCTYSSSSHIYTTTPPAPGYVKNVYISRSLIGTDNKIIVHVVGYNLTGNLYTYNE